VKTVIIESFLFALAYSPGGMITEGRISKSRSKAADKSVRPRPTWAMEGGI
jgi:hypothetical protein